MIEVAVLHEEGWPGPDWEFLAQQAVSAAIAHSPYAAFATDSTLYEVAVKLTDDAGADKTWEQIRDECALLALQNANLPTPHQDPAPPDVP